MKIATYVEANRKALPTELAELLEKEQSIWTNDACYGYCIRAMESARCDRETIGKAIICLNGAFDEMTVEEAEELWRKW